MTSFACDTERFGINPNIRSGPTDVEPTSEIKYTRAQPNYASRRSVARDLNVPYLLGP